MANNVTVKIVGGDTKDPQEYDEDTTIGDLKEEYGLEGYTATVNGAAKGDEYKVQDYAFVTMAPGSKGGC